MIKILLLLLSLTTAELFTCRFTLWWLIVFVDRFLFSLRRIGAVLPAKRLVITEGVATVIMLLFHLVMSKGNIPWQRMGFTILFNLASCGVMLWDHFFMVYETVDITDEEDSI